MHGLVRVMKASYLPFLMVYFAYGLTSITGIAVFFWTKDVLKFSATELQLAAFWAGVPWTLKMLFGQFVDVRPILGSPRRAYIFVGAMCVACGYLMFAGLAGGWSPIVALGSTLSVYYIAAVAVAIGLVIQDVTADAMTSEMNTGDERDARSIQTLGRIALAIGALVGAWFASTLAFIGDNGGRNDSYHVVFLIVCAVPLISILGAIMWKQHSVEREEWSKPILFGGLGFAFFVIAIQFVPTLLQFIIWFLEVSEMSWIGKTLTILVSIITVAKAEIVWLGTAIAVGTFLCILARRLEKEVVLALVATAAVAFVFRCVPSAGPGVGWWQVDVLGFDRDFLGWLQTIGSVLGLLGLVLAARSLRNHSVAPVLAFLTVITTVLTLPIVGMYFGLHLWTEEHFGFGARTIAIIDVTLGSPFDQLSMVPILAFIAMVARFGNPATWFALAASLMNLALTTSTITTKWLTQLWPVTQAQVQAGVPGDYSNLGVLLILTTTLGFVLPLLMIWIFRKQLNYKI
ncbi:MAG: hypothetical protein Q8R25_04205 [bacterium]|nr:hypothetical protein [bacterium]